MRFGRSSAFVLAAISALFLASACCSTKSQTVRSPEVQQMSISGEIAKAEQGWIIRGKVPSEIFTILNPGPKLEKYNQEGKIVKIEARVVSGDNVEIKSIDGEEY